MSFSIVDVSDWPTERDEPMGGKTKQWRRDPDDQLRLFKGVHRRTAARPGEGEELVGEHWAEKVAADLARLVGVPAATVELATDGVRVGCISLRMLGEDEEHVNDADLGSHVRLLVRFRCCRLDTNWPLNDPAFQPIARKAAA